MAEKGIESDSRVSKWLARKRFLNALIIAFGFVVPLASIGLAWIANWAPRWSSSIPEVPYGPQALWLLLFLPSIRITDRDRDLAHQSFGGNDWHCLGKSL